MILKTTRHRNHHRLVNNNSIIATTSDPERQLPPPPRSISLRVSQPQPTTNTKTRKRSCCHPTITFTNIECGVCHWCDLGAVLFSSLFKIIILISFVPLDIGSQIQLGEISIVRVLYWYWQRDLASASTTSSLCHKGRIYLLQYIVSQW